MRGAGSGAYRIAPAPDEVPAIGRGANGPDKVRLGLAPCKAGSSLRGARPIPRCVDLAPRKDPFGPSRTYTAQGRRPYAAQGPIWPVLSLTPRKGSGLTPRKEATVACP